MSRYSRWACIKKNAPPQLPLAPWGHNTWKRSKLVFSYACILFVYSKKKKCFSYVNMSSRCFLFERSSILCPNQLAYRTKKASIYLTSTMHIFYRNGKQRQQSRPRSETVSVRGRFENGVEDTTNYDDGNNETKFDETWAALIRKVNISRKDNMTNPVRFVLVKRNPKVCYQGRRIAWLKSSVSEF